MKSKAVSVLLAAYTALALAVGSPTGAFVACAHAGEIRRLEAGLAEGLALRAGEHLLKRKIEAAAEQRAIREGKGFFKWKSDRLPANGRWSGEPGNSLWHSDHPHVQEVTSGKGIPFVNGHPDFGEWSKGRVEVPGMTGQRGSHDFSKTYAALGKQRGTSAAEAASWLEKEGLTPHHLPNGREMEIVVKKVHANVTHGGGAYALRQRWVP